MATVYHQRTVPSAVLGEYLADVQRAWDFTEPSPWPKDVNRLYAHKSILAPYLGYLWGDEVGIDYLRYLLNRAKRQRDIEHEEAWAKRREEAAKWRAKAEAPRVEEPKPKPKVKRTDAAYNEGRMRKALLALANPKSGWVKAGIRELARTAGMPHRTARNTLARMAAEGQVELDRKWGQGNPTGVHPLRDHPAWSEHDMAQLSPKALASALLRV